MYAFVGIILLVGLVKKNGIMMVDFAIEAQRDKKLTPTPGVAVPDLPPLAPSRGEGRGTDRARACHGGRAGRAVNDDSCKTCKK